MTQPTKLRSLSSTPETSSLQRDNILEFLPGQWGFWRSHQPGETPSVAVARTARGNQLCPTDAVEFGCYADSQVIRHYHAPLTVELNQLVLAEGWDMGLLTPDHLTGQLILKPGQVRCDLWHSSPTNFVGFYQTGCLKKA